MTQAKIISNHSGGAKHNEGVSKRNIRLSRLSRAEPDAPLRPLVLDLDGALIRADLLVEGMASLLRRNPLFLFALLWWLVRGRAFLKRKVAQWAAIDIDALPVNEELVAFARAERAKGRIVVLATAADEIMTRRLAKRFDFIDEVMSSNGGLNLKGQAKAAALIQAYPAGFDYAGDARADLPVWRAAHGVIIVEASPKLTRMAGKFGKTLAIFPRLSRFAALRKSLRLHQWAKNVLIFAPLMLGGKAADLTAWTMAATAFLALGLTASATYLLNDIWDLPHDRKHWSKRSRPIASGHLPITHAASASALGLGAGLMLAFAIGWPVALAIAAYVILTLAYSMSLKRVAILDAATLGGLFSLRIAIGVAAAGVVWSPWLLTFSMFLFTSLSFAKRHVEMRGAQRQGRSGKLAGRGYTPADEPVILSFGIATGIASVVIFILYLNQEAFRNAAFVAPLALWLFPPILFLWLGRIWTLCAREELQDDPVAFAVRDPVSLALGVIVGIGFFIAALGLPPNLT